MAENKPESPFTPKSDPAVTGIGGEHTATAWNPTAVPLDKSPVKTAVAPPPGWRKWRPKTVAEHNAWVESLGYKEYPPSQST